MSDEENLPIDSNLKEFWLGNPYLNVWLASHFDGSKLLSAEDGSKSYATFPGAPELVTRWRTLYRRYASLSTAYAAMMLRIANLTIFWLAGIR